MAKSKTIAEYEAEAGREDKKRAKQFVVPRKAPSINKAVPNTPVKGKRDLSVRVSDTGETPTAVEQEVEKVFGMQPGLARSGLIPFRRNPVTRNIEAVAPQALYDAARAFVAPSVALQGKPMDMQDEALNFAVNFTGAGAPRALAARPLEGGAVELGMSGGRRTAPSIAALRDVRPSRENVRDVIAANTNAGRLVGERSRPISELTGGVSNAADDQRRVAALADAMSGPEGYVERLIVDDAGNVIEGQHRLEALRKLGATEVPVTEYRDFGRDLSLSDLQKAASEAQSIHPDQANQIAANLAEIFADEGGNMAEVRLYEPPKGFEDAWSAAMGQLEAQAAPASDLAVRRVVPASIAFDPRIEARVGEKPKVEQMSVELAPRRTEEPKPLSVFDLEGKPFITSMSDMSAAGDDITAINDVPLAEPVSRRGGQDYMFDNPGSVWAADLGSAGRHLDLARRLKTETGENPIYLPWAMGPTAIDFAHMPRELMLQYAASSMGKRGQQALSKDIRGVIPDFRAVDDPTSVEMFREATGKQRAALNRLLDQYRDKGGIGMGAARLATTDLNQIGAPLTSLRNVGMIDAGAALSPSTHPSYRTSIPGEGLGRLQEPVGALELLPDLMAGAELTGPFDFPVGVVPGVKSPMRALQMGPKGGVITEEMLRAIEDRLAVRKGAKPKKP